MSCYFPFSSVQTKPSLAALVVSVSAAAVDKTKELDAAQDLIINLNKVSTLDRK